MLLTEEQEQVRDAAREFAQLSFGPPIRPNGMGRPYSRARRSSSWASSNSWE